MKQLGRWLAVSRGAGSFAWNANQDKSGVRLASIKLKSDPDLGDCVIAMKDPGGRLGCRVCRRAKSYPEVVGNLLEVWPCEPDVELRSTLEVLALA